MAASDVFVSVAYALYVIAPAIRQEVWLRLTLLINSAGFAVWGVWIGSWPVVVANVLFCFMSLRQLRRAWDERRPADLGPEALAIATRFFPGVEGRSLETLWRSADVLAVTEADLTVYDTSTDHLWIMLDGEATITLADDTRLVTKEPSMFGEVTAMDPANRLATASVSVTDARLMRWSHETIAEMMQQRPTLRSPFVEALSRQMADRIVRTERVGVTQR